MSLPQPATTTEMYLAAILDELRQSRNAPDLTEEPQKVELREPRVFPKAPKPRAARRGRKEEPETEEEPEMIEITVPNLNVEVPWP